VLGHCRQATCHRPALGRVEPPLYATGILPMIVLVMRSRLRNPRRVGLTVAVVFAGLFLDLVAVVVRGAEDQPAIDWKAHLGYATGRYRQLGSETLWRRGRVEYSGEDSWLVPSSRLVPVTVVLIASLKACSSPKRSICLMRSGDCPEWCFEIALVVRPCWSNFAVVAQVLDEDVSEYALSPN